MEEKRNSLLIVDDEIMNLSILTHILGDEYSIYTAANGMDAVEKARKHIPDLILLDVIMPEMDGYEAIAELKKHEEIRRIPVVFISGLDSNENEEIGLALGAADYISKPFSAMLVKLRVRNQIQIINNLRTIERISMIDQLTNLPNRRCFDNRIHMEWNQAIRERTSISLLMMDLDKFKDFNDTYGHQQGDAILMAIADIFLRSFKRPGDFVARWGGEEFVALLPNTPLAGAVDVAERIRKETESTEIPGANDSVLRITLSIGVHSQIPVPGSPISDFIFNADKALYASKGAGRNKVTSSLDV